MLESRLMISISVPLASPEVGGAVYQVVKDEIIRALPEAMISGQVVKFLEPCCGQKGKNVPIPSVPQKA
jgi:hypothetical protein